MFYDKQCTIKRFVVIDKDWTDIQSETLLYKNLPCDYYLAPRGNVVNRLESEQTREQDKDRLDCVIPWTEFDEARKIIQWDLVELTWPDVSELWQYMVDQVDYYYMPSWALENVYLRLNQIV